MNYKNQTNLSHFIDPSRVGGNAANMEDRTIRLFYMRIDLNSQKRIFVLFCSPDWLHSHDVLLTLHFVLCSRDLDVLRAQRIIGFFSSYLSTN